MCVCTKERKINHYQSSCLLDLAQNGIGQKSRKKSFETESRTVEFTVPLA